MRRRIISLLLCVACLLPICRPMEAHAIVGVDDAALLAAGGVALVGSLLVAGGAKFAANEDVQRVAQDIYDRYIVPSAELSLEVTRICTDWRYAKSLGKRVVINVSARLWEAICSGPVKTEVEAGRYGAVGGVMTVDLEGENAWFDFVNVNTNSCRFFTAFGVRANQIAYKGHTYAVRKFPYNDTHWLFVAYLDGVEVDRDFGPKEYVSSSQPYFNTCTGVPGRSDCFSVSCGLAGERNSHCFPSPALEVPYGSAGCGSITFSVAGAAEISYPIDSDLIRPGDKSATVQLPSDLPRYGEDGATVEMPVISLDQTDYIIADGDVISSATSEEDVILDAATGERVQADTDVSNPDKPIAGTGVLDWLKGILKGLLDTIIALLTAIRDGVLAIPDLIAKAIAAIFVPSDAVVKEVQASVNDRLPVVPSVKKILDDCGNLMQHPDQAASGLGLTTIVDLGKHVGGGWGDKRINLLDASWFLVYKDTTDDIFVGIAWLVFLWNLYGALPGIIHGAASGSMSFALFGGGAAMPDLEVRTGRKELPPHDY